MKLFIFRLRHELWSIAFVLASVAAILLFLLSVPLVKLNIAVSKAALWLDAQR